MKPEIRCPNYGHLVIDDVPWLCPSCACMDHAPACLCGHPIHGDEKCPRPECGCRTSIREAA